MLYLKNTLGGWSRSLTDSALSSFQGPHRWWKLALFAVLFILPGGSVGVVVLAWVEHRRGRKGGQTETAMGKAAPAAIAKAGSGSTGTIGQTASHSGTGPCQARGDAPCRAAAGKQARQTKSADSRA
ncbi:hypothetical protein [Paraburkholderia sp. BCC1884]|uniref:hypothetical protein n=1 Tax=Paraburkholderia sp. BCC1884 TaxID=2562668 RepID=UPI0011827486|nr:hypothetical protein [Paraburkholderia sp. BCC1884]